MAAKKSGSAARSKSQASVPGPKNGAATPKVTGIDDDREWRKRLRGQYLKFKGLQARQKVVEQARRAVYAYLLELTHENIELAKQGNSSAAKFLTKLAGIDEIPALVEAISKTKKAAGGCDDDDPTKAVLSFYKKLGMEPLRLKPPQPKVDTEDLAPASIGEGVLDRTTDVSSAKADSESEHRALQP